MYVQNKLNLREKTVFNKKLKLLLETLKYQNIFVFYLKIWIFCNDEGNFNIEICLTALMLNSRQLILNTKNNNKMAVN